MKNHRRRGRGILFPVPCSLVPAFTLLELLVVLTIIVVLSGMIVPRMGGSLSHQEVVEAAASFAHTARMTREVAIARRQVFAILIDDKGYGVQKKSESGSFQAVQVSWLRPQRWGDHIKLQGIKTPDGKAVNSGSHRLEFRPDGSSTGAAIRLSSGETHTMVVVEPGSGRASYGENEEIAESQQTIDLGD